MGQRKTKLHLNHSAISVLGVNNVYFIAVENVLNLIKCINEWQTQKKLHNDK